MKREITLKFTQTIPEQYIENRKTLKQASDTIVGAIKNEFNFDGDIEVVEAKEYADEVVEYEQDR